MFQPPLHLRVGGLFLGLVSWGSVAQKEPCSLSAQERAKTERSRGCSPLCVLTPFFFGFLLGEKEHTQGRGGFLSARQGWAIKKLGLCLSGGGVLYTSVFLRDFAESVCLYFFGGFFFGSDF